LQQEQLGIDYLTGAYVTTVVEGSPADEAGIIGAELGEDQFSLQTGGDLIIGVDGRPVREFGELLSYIMVHKSPGDEITLDLVRDGEEIQVSLTLGKRP
jgi:2-alkenal reductase